MKYVFKVIGTAALSLCCISLSAQKYQGGLVDKTIAVIGNEMISISTLEEELKMASVQGGNSDAAARCEFLERLLDSKIFLKQARLDSLKANADIVDGQLNQRMDHVRTMLGGDEGVVEYFGKPIYKLRQEWRKQIEDMSLTQQEQQEIAGKVPELTPNQIKTYIDTVNVDALPMVPTKYQLSQICIYPDKEAASLAVKERLLSIRERILNGEKFSTLARLYSEDPGSARKGGELGMASKSIFWPAFSDAAMALKPGIISQIVETPDGFHLIEVIEKKGDMFNARHILMKPKYDDADREKAFKELDSLRTEILDSNITFDLAARFFSEDPVTRTNGGQMADPNTGSAYFEMDQLKPQDYTAIKDLAVGQISQPIESLDNEGRDGNLVYKIVRLDKIVESHTARMETDYNEVLEVVERGKQMEALEKFIDSKIKSTYIVIDPIFKDCEFSREGWAEKFRKD